MERKTYPAEKISVHPGEYIALIIFHKEKGILLVREGRENGHFNVNAKDLNVVTETVNEEDRTFDQALTRAIDEELSPKNPDDFKYISESYHYGKKNKIHTAFVEFTGDPEEINKFSSKEDREIIGYQWFNPKKLKDIVNIFKEPTYGQLLSWVFPALMRNCLRRFIR